MRLTTQQVAKRLGISDAQVLNLMRRGDLVDLRAAEDRRHMFAFDSHAVAEYAIGAAPPKAVPPPPAPVATAPVAPSPALGVVGAIAGRLERIEAKLDQLLQAWA
jgi:hypothetical protein